MIKPDSGHDCLSAYLSYLKISNRESKNCKQFIEKREPAYQCENQVKGGMVKEKYFQNNRRMHVFLKNQNEKIASYFQLKTQPMMRSISKKKR